ncbi:MAG: hypothetical protein GXP37_00830 [Chloroflexi bacterium]|nr:hypothetical protein [Chloroflexota bacterium]
MLAFILLSACRRSQPIPGPTPTPFVAPTPPPIAATVGLGPAPIDSLDFVHQPFGDGACGVCHDLQGPDPTQLWGAVQDVCRDCHWQEVPSEDAKLVHAHQPFEQGDCIACHAPHASSQPQLLIAPITELCNSCHDDHKTIIDQPHPSLAAGECNLCHIAHGSDFVALLRQPPAKLCGTCHPDEIDPSKSYAEHAQSPDLKCTECHNPHDPKATPPLMSQAACSTCHEKLVASTSYTRPHAPYKQGKCQDCHPSFHKNPDAPLLSSNQARICNTCHEDHGQVIHQTHPEIAKGECLLCHDGHGSNQPYLLVKSEAQTCQSCHPQPFDQSHTFNGHAADRLPACSTCHSPHQPQSTGAKIAQTCTTCHDDILPANSVSSHEPVVNGDCHDCHPQFHGDQPRKLAVVPSDICTTCHVQPAVAVPHEPVANGECTSCHGPHSSTQPMLLLASTSQLCGQCHAEQAASFSHTQHAQQLASQCAACHQPHGGDNAALLKERTNTLCEGCHQDLPHGFHPVSGGRDPLRGEELSCISCHSPHGSDNIADLRASGDALCLSCHNLQSPTAFKSP